MFKISLIASLLLLGESAPALEAQSIVALEVLGDRWPSAESRTNLGLGMGWAWDISDNARLAFSADYMPWGLGKPEGMVRASYFDSDLGLLLYPANFAYVGAGVGVIVTTIKGAPPVPPPGGYTTRGQRHGWTTPVRVGLIPLRGSEPGEEASVEVQYWRRLPVQNQAGVVKSDRWVVAVHVWYPW